MKPWLRMVIYGVALVAITAFISSAVTVNIIRDKQGDVVTMSLEEYEQLNKIAVFNEIKGVIKDTFYGSVPDDETLVSGAANGMIDVIGDNYAKYYTDEEYREYLKKTDGEYVGIGVVLGQPVENGTPIMDVNDDQPADKAGMKPGDIITHIGGTAVAGKSLEEVDILISGQEGDKLTVSVLRDQSVENFTVELAKLNYNRVFSALYSQRTGYIRIEQFTGNCVEEFNEAIRDLNDRGMRSLVVDVRNNPGGELENVISITDAIIGEGKIISVRNADGTIEEFTSNANRVTVPLAVLVNENSASASEVLAAAVQDNGAGIIVGVTTYGKGLVQSTKRLVTNQAWLKLTTAAYYTPNGKNIQGIGVIPDIDIDLADDLKNKPIDTIEQDDDAQLWAALDEIRAQAEAQDAA